MKAQLTGRLVEVVWTPPGCDPITFTVKPLTMTEALAFAELHAEPGAPGAQRTAATLKAMVDVAVAHVVGWEGVEHDGGPAPCTPETRRVFFEAYLDAVPAIMTPAVQTRGLSGGPDEVKESGGGSSTSTPAA